MRKLLSVLAASSLSVLAFPVGVAGSSQSDERFPLRAKYEDIRPIEMRDLLREYDQAIIIDCRTKVEFDVVHLRNAVHLDLDEMHVAHLEELRAKSDARPIVFYCNGVTCAKSYDAARIASEWGFENVFVLDAGVFTFVNIAPQNGVFFGRPMTREMLQLLISEEDQKKVRIPAAEFAALARSGEWTVFDLRSEREAERAPIRISGVHRLTMDEFIEQLSQPGKIPPGRLLFIDNVGRQVAWLHYYLRRAGRTDFRFAEGGVAGWQRAGLSPEGTQLAGVP